MNNNFKKTLTYLLAATLSVGAFMACANTSATDTSSSSSSSSTASNEPKDSLVIATANEPSTLHPFDHKAVASSYMNKMTFNTLFCTDTANSQFVPDLVETYENLDDVTWQFTIHEGVKFHDGTDMTTEDVLASLEYARTFTTTADYSGFWTDVTATDDYTFVMTTDGPYSEIFSNLASLKVLPSELIESGNDFSANPVGSGPYKLVTWTLGDKIVFEKFDDYYDENNQPTIQNVTWRIIPEGSSRTIALEAGEVDLLVDVEPSDIARLEESEVVDLFRVESPRQNFLTVNNEVFPFNNVDFRKALNTAIDKESIVLVATNGEGVVASSMTPMNWEGSTLANTETYDPEKAKAYLEASGVDPSTVSFSCIASTDVNRRIAEMIQATLHETLGVTMEIVSMDHASYLSAIMSGEYEAALSGYSSSTMGVYLTGLLHSDSLNAANLPRFQNEELDGYIDLAKTQIDTEARVETYTKATELLNENVPYIPLYNPILLVAYNSDLEGVQCTNTGTINVAGFSWKS